MKRIFRFPIYEFLGVGCIIFCSLYFIVATSHGTRMLIGALHFFAKDHFYGEAIEGNLLQGHLRGKKMHLQFSGSSIDVENFAIEWNSAALFQKQIEIFSFYAEKIQPTVDFSVKSTETQLYLPWFRSLYLHSFHIDAFAQSHLDMPPLQLVGSLSFHNPGILHLPLLQWRAPTLGGSLRVEANLLEQQISANSRWHGNVGEIPIDGNGSLYWPNQTRAEQAYLHLQSIPKNPLAYQINIEGSAIAQQASLYWRYKDYRFVINNVQTSLNKGTLAATIHDLQLQGLKHPVLLKQPVQLEATLESAHLRNACFLYQHPQPVNACFQADFFQNHFKALLHAEANSTRPFDNIVVIPGLSGKVQSDISLQGSYIDPAWEVKVHLNEGEYFIPGLKRTVRQVEGDFVLDGSKNATTQAFTLNTQGLLSKKPLTVYGNGTITPEFQYQFFIEGQNLPLLNERKRNVLLDANLKLSYENDRLTIGGSAHIPEARIVQEEASGARSSSDVVIIDTEKPPQESLKVFTDLQATLGDKVFFKGFGLDAQLKGGLHVYGPASDLKAKGKIQLNGSYNAYDRTLTITDARLEYQNNPLYNPNLFIRAKREIPIDINDSLRTEGDTLKAFVQVTGSYQNPNLLLYSHPSLPQSEVLSYLVFGRNTDLASAAEAEILLQAAKETFSFLGLSPKNQSLTSQIKQRFQIDELSISSSEDPTDNRNTPNVSVNVGKRVSKKLYLQLSYGFAEALSSLRVKYLLSPKWSLIGTTNADGSGADLVYQVQSDK